MMFNKLNIKAFYYHLTEYMLDGGFLSLHWKNFFSRKSRIRTIVDRANNQIVCNQIYIKGMFRRTDYTDCYYYIYV